MLLKTYCTSATLSEVFSTGTEWALVMPFTSLPADGQNLNPHGVQTDGKMLAFSFQSSVLILLSSESTSGTGYACYTICNICHGSHIYIYIFESTENPLCEVTLPALY